MNTNNITTGVRRTLGGMYRAASGTSLPTDATTTLASAFKDLGYIHEDGVTKTKSRETVEVKDWAGETVKVVKTQDAIEYSFKAIEFLNEDTIKAVYGSNNVTGTVATGLAIVENNSPLEEAVYVMDEVSLDGVLMRTVIPRGVISELGDEIHKKDEVLSYDMKLKALPDASGNSTYKYMIQGPAGTTGATGASN